MADRSWAAPVDVVGVKTVQTGDQRSFALTRAGLMEGLWQLRSPLRSFIFGRLSVNGPSADDVVSDTYLVVWRRLEEAPNDVEQAFRWLCGISRRVAANRWRASRRAAALLDKISLYGDPLDWDVAAGHVDRILAMQAWCDLVPRDQEILLLVGLDGLSTDDLAVALGCSSSAAMQRLARARARLRKALE